MLLLEVGIGIMNLEQQWRHARGIYGDSGDGEVNSGYEKCLLVFGALKYIVIASLRSFRTA